MQDVKHVEAGAGLGRIGRVIVLIAAIIITTDFVIGFFHGVGEALSR